MSFYFAYVLTTCDVFRISKFCSLLTKINYQHEIIGTNAPDIGEPLGFSFYHHHLQIADVTEGGWADRFSNMKDYLQYRLIKVNGVRVRTQKQVLAEVNKRQADQDLVFTVEKPWFFDSSRLPCVICFDDKKQAYILACSVNNQGDVCENPHVVCQECLFDKKKIVLPQFFQFSSRN